MYNENIILNSDSYKFSHFMQYPQGTTKLFSYLESRGGLFDETVFFGLQYILKNHLVGKVITKEKIDKAEQIVLAHGLSFNRDGWEYILNKYNGHLPLEIKAVSEGSVVSTKNVLLTVENTDDKCFWLTNFMESLLLHVWYPTTVATLSREMKKIIKLGLEKTSDNCSDADLLFKLHDFGYRSCTSNETAKIGSMAHLVNFLGTDTILGVEALMDFYNVKDVQGFSINASEHSSITSWGKEHECDAFENMLDKYPKGLVACVSDSFDIYQAVKDYWGTNLRNKIMNRDGTLVIRPDSGDAKVVLPELLNFAWDKFGGHVNNKGYKVLTEKVRFIWGDTINLETLPVILQNIQDAGFSTENCAFGMGTALLQNINRDTQKFAFKCSAIKVDGEWRDVFKNPIHDAFKKSKQGRLGLFKKDNGEFFTCELTDQNNDGNLLQTVFKNGQLTREEKFDVIRERAKL